MRSPSHYLLLYHDCASECIEQTKSESPKNWNKSKNSPVEGGRALVCTSLMGIQLIYLYSYITYINVNLSLKDKFIVHI